jgi:hypothetical protein
MTCPDFSRAPNIADHPDLYAGAAGRCRRSGRFGGVLPLPDASGAETVLRIEFPGDLVDAWSRPTRAGRS